MFVTHFERTMLPQWALVLAIVAVSPAPLVLPSGIALAAFGLLGSALVLRRWREHERPALVSHAPVRVAARP